MGFFQLASKAEREAKNMLLPLPKKFSEELMILSALAPIAVTNIATSMCNRVFASDASLGLGAVVSTRVDSELSEVLWLGSDKKGCYTRLDADHLSLLAAAGEETDEIETGASDEHDVTGPKEGPLLYYDFVEFFGGSGRVSACMAEG